MKYQWTILQDGHLPLQLDGRVSSEEHVCTVTLIWPLDALPDGVKLGFDRLRAIPEPAGIVLWIMAAGGVWFFGLQRTSTHLPK